MKIKMFYSRETLRKVVFDEEEEEPKLGSLYITKEAWEELGEPHTIIVEIKIE